MATVCVVCADEPPYGRWSYMGGRCFGRMRRDLAAVQWAHGLLGAQLVALPAAWKAGSIHAAAGPRPPMNVALHDVRVDIEGKLWSWVRLILEESATVLRGPQTTDVTTVAGWLRERERLSWCSEQPWCDEYARELADLRSSAYALAPWGRHRIDMPLPCPACSLLSLALFGGDDLITCRSSLCGRTMTAAQYEAEVAAWWQRANTRREVLV